jgi:glycosyltransferase involved in cell wall biosynthesis
VPVSLRIALLAYRGNPYSGGQGVYVRHLSRELVRLGHRVTVIGGQPYPDLDDVVELIRLPSLDLYAREDPFRLPKLAQFRDWIDLLEFAMVCTASFPEPLTFSLRARRYLKDRRQDFDLVHDNQGLGYGLLSLGRLGLPLVATIHHAVEIDREMQLAAETTMRRKLNYRRWYSFARMQRRVARRLPAILTVSEAAKRDIVTRCGISPDRVRIVSNGVDPVVFAPRPDIARRPGAIITTASADIPIKGLATLLEAVAKLRTERPVELVVVGKPGMGSPTPALIERLGLAQSVRFVSGVDESALAELYARAEVAVVPSHYEGFSLPAIEAMACGVPVVATTGGALPEVVGRHGETALLVPPADAQALAATIGAALDDAGLRSRMGDAGRRRVLDRFPWSRTAAATVELYEEVFASVRV